MKVVVISLLRLGDVIMSSVLVDGIKRIHPNAEVHFVINDSTSAADQVLAKVDHFHYFPRSRLQSSILDTESSIVEALDILNDWLLSSHFKDFDLAINLTHNKLSGLLMGLIDSNKKVGLTLFQDREPQFGSKWFKYLNECGSQTRLGQFHFADIFMNACELPILNRKYSIQLKDEFPAKESIAPESSGFILLQTLTSDAKKNWGTDSWIEFLAAMKLQFDSKIQFLVLASDSELKTKSEHFKALEDQGCKIAVTDLQESLSLIRAARLLVSSDTSIKHLATATATPIIELSLGSSNYGFTGVYRDDCVIVQPKSSCSPCRHSGNCFQPQHVCAKDVSPDLVAMISRCVIEKNFSLMREISTEYTDKVRVLRTHIDSFGEWNALPINEKFSADSVWWWLERQAVRVLLNRTSDEKSDSISIESLELQETLQLVFGNETSQSWDDELSKLSKKINIYEFELNFMNELLNSLIHKRDRFEINGVFFKQLEEIYRQADVGAFKERVNQFRILFSDSQALTLTQRIRKIKTHLNEQMSLILIEKSMSNHVKIYLSENVANEPNIELTN
jgi:ADP-heptose:LPS heptosyltransferase